MTLLIVIACAVIAGCMIYLFKSGIGLRSATLIRPSVMDDSMSEVGQAVFFRLFPEFQTRDLLVIGAEGPSPRVTAFIENLKRQAESYHKNPIQIFDDEKLLSSHEELSSCSKTCWILTETQSTSDIAPMPSVMQLVGLDEKNRFTISIFEYENYDPAVISNCEKQKVLTLSCLKNLGIKEAQRRIRDASKKHFFLKQYKDRDYFLFLQK